MKLRALLILVLIALVGCESGGEGHSHEEGESVHWHAGFQVYVDDELQDYFSHRFMHVMPCNDDQTGYDHELTAEEEQLEKIHLHDGNGDVAHVHKEEATWGDLFENISVDFEGELRGFVNGEEVENVLEERVGENDSVVIFVGKNTDIEGKVNDRVTEERILEVDALSEDCAGN